MGPKKPVPRTDRVRSPPSVVRPPPKPNKESLVLNPRDHVSVEGMLKCDSLTVVGTGIVCRFLCRGPYKVERPRRVYIPNKDSSSCPVTQESHINPGI